MRRRLLAPGLFMTALLILMSTPSEAVVKSREADARSDGGGAEVNAGFETVGDPQGGGGGGGGRGKGGSLTCTYHVSTAEVGRNDDVQPVPDGSRVAKNPVPGQPYGLTCRDASGNEVVNRVVRYDPATSAPAVDPEVLAQEAAARLAVSPPQVVLSPKVGLNQITQLPTYMWVTNWGPDSASASVPGVTATVTAAPTKVTWNMGNGDQVVCNGPGTPFDFSRPEESQATDCSYTYRHSSTGQPGGVYQVSATMSYDVSWTAEGAPGGGALPDVSATETFPVRVIEIHAVEGVGTGAG